MSGTTSGTVAQTTFPQRKVIDHALRRAGYMPEQTGGEDIQVAQDLLFLILSEWVNAQHPLWTRVYSLLNCTVGSPEVNTPTGTTDVRHVYWRIIQPYRGLATTTGNVSAATLFSGQPGADIVIAGPNPGVIINFGTPTEVDSIGVLLGGLTPLTAALQVQTSTDGFTFTTAQTLPSTTYRPGQWAYFDLDPSLSPQYMQLVSPGAGSWTLNQLNVCMANGQDIEIGPLNIDDYYNLPNKQFQSDRPNSGYVDRQVNFPVLKIWPTPNLNAFYNGTVTALTWRYIQDPGALNNNLELPIRWYNAAVARLACHLMDELPDPIPQAQASYFTLMAKTQRRQLMEQAATKAENLAWSEERERSPIRWMPNLRPYTI